MEFTGLGVEMAQLAGRFGSVDPPSADRRTLEWSVGAGRRLRGMIDAHEAAVTSRLEWLISQPGLDDDDWQPDTDRANDATGASAGAAAGDGSAGGDGEPASGGAAGCPGGGSGAADGAGVDGGSVGEPSGDGGASGSGGSGGGSGSSGSAHGETAEEFRLRLRRAKWLRRLPLFAAALQAGQITTAHVEALAAVFDHVEPTVVAEVIADEAAVLEIARTVTRASFARWLRLRIDRVRGDGGRERLERQIAESFGSLGVDDDLGLHRLFVRLDPIRGEQVYTAIRQRVDQLQQSGAAEGMRRGQVIAQAVTDLICGTATTSGGGVEVLVIVDALTLLDGVHDDSVCETGEGLAIPVEVVRDLCHQPDTTVTAAVRDPDGITTAIGHHDPPPTPPPRPTNPAQPTSGASPDATSGPGEVAGSCDARGPAASGADPDVSDSSGDGGWSGGSGGGWSWRAEVAAKVAAAIAAATGTKLDMGRDIRLANRQQRRALRAMYRSCAHPGCRVPFADCDIHHVTPWEHDGPTDLPNLLPLCGHHHHRVHEGGWRLSIDTDRTLTWRQPGGRVHTRTPFQPLGATLPCDRRDQPSTASGDDEPTDEADRWPQTATAGAPTSTSWNRSRHARGAPPAGPTSSGDDLRLFDPTAA